MTMNETTSWLPSEIRAQPEEPLMDSPEMLGFALCNLLPEMSWGFSIQTHSGVMHVSAANSLPFINAMERLLKKGITQRQREAYKNADIEPSDIPDFTSKDESKP